MKNRKPIFLLIPILLFFGVGYITMLLWNSLIPDIFGLKTITYSQALGLFILSKILFGSFRFGNKKMPFTKTKFGEKMMNMTEEERQKLKEEWKNRCRK
jgi:Ca2+/H+ antiporter, TMEM165/GDT1 family